MSPFLPHDIGTDKCPCFFTYVRRGAPCAKATPFFNLAIPTPFALDKGLFLPSPLFILRTLAHKACKPFPRSPRQQRPRTARTLFVTLRTEGE